MTYTKKKILNREWSACSNDSSETVIAPKEDRSPTPPRQRSPSGGPELWLWGQNSGPPQDLNRTQDSSSMYSQSPGAQDPAWQRKETNNMTRHRRPRLHYLVTLWIHVHGLFPLAVFLNNEDWHSSTAPATHTHVHVHIPTFSLVNPHTHRGLYLGSIDLKCWCASESPGRRVGWTGRPGLTSIHYWYYASNR